MGFIDNSGDIIIDAVLTDEGRARLANGNFKVTKFSLFDDEIDYSLYNKNHASGSSYYDLDILALPVLEAVTNNSCTAHSRLLSIPRQNLLYLPCIKISEAGGGNKMSSAGCFYVSVNEDTEDDIGKVDGSLFGENPAGCPNFVRLDQGLDTTELSPEIAIPADLEETQYIVEMDNRLGMVVDKSSGTGVNINPNGIGGGAGGKIPTASTKRAQPSYIDDDNVASYYFTLNSDPSFVRENPITTAGTEAIAGPRGTILEFKVQASPELNSSTYLFTLLGGTTTVTGTAGSVSVYYIDSTIRVTGATTGFRVDIPVRYLRKV